MKINEENIFIFIEKKDNELVKAYLLENGIDKKDPEQRTALINAAFYNNVELLNWLVKNKAGLNMQDSIGFTALHFACQEGHIESVKLLLENNADLNIVDIYGNTPAWITIMNWKGGKNFSILKELYIHNADLTIKNKAGNSAIKIIPENIMNQLKVK
jgi:ankyrin repeat protein